MSALSWWTTHVVSFRGAYALVASKTPVFHLHRRQHGAVEGDSWRVRARCGTILYEEDRGPGRTITRSTTCTRERAEKIGRVCRNCLKATP